MKTSFTVVPWFSRNEWLEVYENVFSDQYEQWKSAVDFMNSWSVRVHKLPMGVEATLHILQAKCIIHKHDQDLDVQKLAIDRGVSQFVNTVIKSAQRRYFEKKSQEKLARVIKLPVYLIELRNEIIHASFVNSNNNTYQLALQDCFKWIKANYWEMEQSNMQEEIDKFEDKCGANEEIFCRVETQCESLVTLVKQDLVLKRNSKKKFNQIMNDILACLNRSFSLHQSRLSTILINSLLIPLLKCELSNKTTNKQDLSEQPPVISNGLMKVRSILQFIIENGGPTGFICLLVDLVDDEESLPDWIAFFEMLDVDWRHFVECLLLKEKPVLSKLAMSIMEKRRDLFTQDQIDKVRQLSNIMNLSHSPPIEKDTDDNHMDDSDIYTLDDLKEKYNFDDQVSFPLGILNEAQNYPYFYKELILDI